MFILIVDEGKAGHRVQSLGVLQHLQAAGRVEDYRILKCRPTFRGFLRPVVKALWQKLPLRAQLALLSSVKLPEDVWTPDVIISSGGCSCYLGAALAKYYNCPYVYLGVPEKFPPHWFDLIIAPIALDPSLWAPAQVVESAMLSTTVDHRSVAAAAEKYWPEGQPEHCWAVLIGGRSTTHPFSLEDWERFIQGLNTIHQETGVRFLITTSRRTGREVEAIFQTQISKEAVAEMNLYGATPEKVCVQAYLGAAEQVLVTKESLTMLSEAVGAERPVIALEPSAGEQEIPGFFYQYLAKLEQAGAIQTCRIDQIEGLSNGSPERAGMRVAEGFTEPISALAEGRL